jgi:hypothetical protein
VIVRVILSVCLLLCVARVVAASMPPAPDLPAEITLEQSLELLDKHSPRALAEQATVQVVAADRIAAQTLPNPTLNYGGLQLTGGTNTGADSRPAVGSRRRPDALLQEPQLLQLPPQRREVEWLVHWRQRRRQRCGTPGDPVGRGIEEGDGMAALRVEHRAPVQLPHTLAGVFGVPRRHFVAKPIVNAIGKVAGSLPIQETE